PDGRDLWYRRPDLTITLAGVMEAKRLGKREYSLAEPEEHARTTPRATVFLKLNSDGYRRPEVDPSHTHPRIIMAGDSVTFGIVVSEAAPYPRVVERELAAAGQPVEVINAGVEGYSVDHLLWRAAGSGARSGRNPRVGGGAPGVRAGRARLPGTGEA